MTYDTLIYQFTRWCDVCYVFVCSDGGDAGCHQGLEGISLSFCIDDMLQLCFNNTSSSPSDPDTMDDMGKLAANSTDTFG